MNSPWHLYLMSFIYVVAGIMHFIKPKMYMRIMPNYLPFHKELVYLSGLFEIVFGVLLLIPAMTKFAVIGIIAMLTVFLLVHSYMLSNEKAAAGFPKWLLIMRIPIQFVLIYWAFSYF